MRFTPRHLRTLAYAAALSVAGGPALADGFFDGLTGWWKGEGLVRTTVKSPEENIRCQIRTDLNGKADRLNIIGNCVIGGFILPVNGYIRDGGKSFEADLFRDLARLTSSTFRGRARGATLRLRYDGRDIDTNQKISAAMIIAKKSKAFDVSLSRTDPETSRHFDVGTVRFEAR